MPILKAIETRRRLFMLFIFLILFFLLQILVLFCCLAAGNDPTSQELSDREQMEYIQNWMKKHSGS